MELAPCVVGGELPADGGALLVAGGLMAYGESMRATYRGAADHIDRILQGASPAELPIVRPSWTQLVVNLGTARALGITIPQRLLDQATEVIQ